jgi:methyl-accepting chemotaxis protein
LFGYKEVGNHLKMNFEPINIFVELIAKTIGKVIANSVGIDISYEENNQSIDERIKKIELAKENLKEGLLAIEDLEKEAEKNKKEVKDAILKINELNENKTGLEEELKTIKEVISSDVNAFKKVAGIPSQKQIKKERVLGFISGVIASIIASLIVMLAIWAYKNYL